MATIHPVAVAVAVAASLVVAMPCDVCVPTWVPGLDPRHICWWPGRGTCETWELRNRHWWNQIEDHTQDKYWNTLTCSPALNSIVTLAPDCRRLQKRDFLVCLTRQIKKKLRNVSPASAPRPCDPSDPSKFGSPAAPAAAPPKSAQHWTGSKIGTTNNHMENSFKRRVTQGETYRTYERLAIVIRDLTDRIQQMHWEITCDHTPIFGQKLQ